MSDGIDSIMDHFTTRARSGLCFLGHPFTHTTSFLYIRYPESSTEEFPTKSKNIWDEIGIKFVSRFFHNGGIVTTNTVFIWIWRWVLTYSQTLEEISKMNAPALHVIQTDQEATSSPELFASTALRFLTDGKGCWGQAWAKRYRYLNCIRRKKIPL